MSRPVSRRQRVVDALGQAQAHQQQFVCFLGRRQEVVGDDAGIPVFDHFQPGLGMPFGSHRMATLLADQPAVCPRADAGIEAVAPVGEVVTAFGAGHRVVRHLVGRHAFALGDLLGRLVEHGRQVTVGHDQFAGLVQAVEGRAFLDRQLV